MRKMLSVVLVLMICVLLVLSGCSAKSANDMAFQGDGVSAGKGGFLDSFGGLSTGSASAPQYESDMKLEESESPEEDLSTQESQKLIKTGQIELEVKDINEKYSEVKLLLSKYNGYVVDMQERSNSYQSNLILELKVQASNFEVLFEELKGVGKVGSASISTQDVTTEYIDTDARVKTLKVQEETLLNIMSKAVKVEDLLRVETELQRVRENIESSQGRLKYLDNRISYSVITLNMTTTKEPTLVLEENTSIFEKFLFNFKDGVGFWGNAFLNLVLGILWMLPVIIVGILVVVFIKKKVLKKVLKKVKKIDKDKK